MVEAEQRPRILLVNRCMVLNDISETLLIRRSSLDRHGAGLWEFPGGKLDEGQDVSHALEREVLEETGLLVDPLNSLFYVESKVIAEGPYKGLTYIVLIGIGKLVGGKLRLSEEHDTFKWVHPSGAYDLELKPEVRNALIVFNSQPISSQFYQS